MKINNKNYTIPELDFNAVCSLEKMGVTFGNMNDQAFGTMRAFLALALGGDVETAGKELEKHIVNGGTYEELIAEINRVVEESGFFQALLTMMMK